MAAIDTGMAFKFDIKKFWIVLGYFLQMSNIN